MNINRENIENLLQLKLPQNFDNYDPNTQISIVEYLKSLDTIERKAYSIGIEHLGTSFNIVKSNGYNSWKKKK